MPTIGRCPLSENIKCPHCGQSDFYVRRILAEDMPVIHVLDSGYVHVGFKREGTTLLDTHLYCGVCRFEVTTQEVGLGDRLNIDY